MEIQVATLCDSAMDYNGKLCVLGAFDTICSRTKPVVHPHCSLALRICFMPGDEGDHELVIKFIDADGKPIVRPIESKVHVNLPQDGYFASRNIVLGLQRLAFKEVGLYSIDVLVDGEILTRIPLRVVLIDPAKAADGSGGGGQ